MKKRQHEIFSVVAFSIILVILSNTILIFLDPRPCSADRVRGFLAMHNVDSCLNAAENSNTCFSGFGLVATLHNNLVILNSFGKNFRLSHQT